MRNLRRMRRAPVSRRTLTAMAQSGITTAAPASGFTPPLSDWTQFTISSPFAEGDSTSPAGTRAIFVSQSTGNDANHGTKASPVKTLSQGISMLRAGKPDWLLLLSGDTWTDEQMSFTANAGGASMTITSPLPAPVISGMMVISTYDAGFTLGTTQPGTGAMAHIKTNTGSNGITCGNSDSRNEGNFTAFTNLDFYSYKRDPANPSYDAVNADLNPNPGYHNTCDPVSNNTDSLVEGCWFRFYGGNDVQIGGSSFVPNTKAWIRRCVISDNWDAHGHAQGWYTQILDLFVMEECFLINNGFNDTIGGGAGKTIYNHNAYIQASGWTADFRGNITALASATGCQQRTGGLMFGNAAIQCPIGLDFGGGDVCGADEPGASGGSCNYNVVLEGNDIDSSNRRGTGIDCHNNLLDYTVHHNLIKFNNTANNSNSRGIHGLSYIGPNGTVTCSNNIIYNWTCTSTARLVHNEAGTPAKFVDSSNNKDLNGTNDGAGGLAPSEPFANPGRTVGNYMTSLGLGSTTADFLTACRAQRRGNWNSNLTGYALCFYMLQGVGVAWPAYPAYMTAHG